MNQQQDSRPGSSSSPLPLTDGRTLPGEICQTPGGVGRNIADCLGKLQGSTEATSFVSAVGNDQFGNFLLKSLKHVNTSGVRTIESGRTACYCALINSKGDAEIAVGDMDIHSNISPVQLEKQKKILSDSSFIVFDGNIPDASVNYLLYLSESQRLPVWFEPTDVLKAPKPFKSDLWKNISCSSPNMNELKEMAGAIVASLNLGRLLLQHLNVINTSLKREAPQLSVAFEWYNLKEDLAISDASKLLQQLTFLARPLVEHIPLIMITMGKLGILMVSKIKPEESVRDKLVKHNNTEIYARYYPTMPLPSVTNSLGAGDSTAAGFIDGLLQGLTEPECVTLGHFASREALRSARAVPNEFKYDRSRPTKASYHEVVVN